MTGKVVFKVEKRRLRRDILRRVGKRAGRARVGYWQWRSGDETSVEIGFGMDLLLDTYLWDTIDLSLFRLPLAEHRLTI